MTDRLVPWGKIWRNETYTFTDDEWASAQKTLEKQAEDEMRRAAVAREAALLGITYDDLMIIQNKEASGLYDKFVIHAYIHEGSRLRKHSDADAHTFDYVYVYGQGAQYAVIQKTNPPPTGIMLVDLWATPSSYTVAKNGKYSNVSEALLLETNVMRFPHVDAAIAAGVIKAWKK